jgi:hypothetical protein
MRIQNILASALLITLTAAFSETKAQTVITEWNFDGADNTSIPGGTNSPQPSTGTGTAHLVGNVISPSFNNGYTGSCNASSGSCGWQTTAYPDQSTASGTAGVEFRVSTVGFRDIIFDYAHRASGTSSRWARIEYMTDGCTWNVLANNGGGLSPHDTYYDFSFDLSACEECNNNPDFRVRIVSIYSPVGFSDFGNTFGANQAYQQARATPTNAGHNYTGASGTWRFDNVSVLGSPAANTISTGVPTGVPVCVGESITIPYTASGTFTGGNVFTAQLSDEFGCFSNPVDIGSVTLTTSGSIDADVPLSTIAGTGYRVRVIAANPLIYGVPSSSSVTVNALPTVTASAMESVLCEGQSTVLTGGGASSYVWDNSAINGQSISPSGTTTYTVIGTDVNGCENTASVQVTVNPLPTVTAQATETVLCAGESTILTGSGAVSYVWDSGALNGQSIVPTQSATYTVVGTDGNSCENSATVDVTVNALPTVTANASETVLCGGGSTILTGNGAVSYAWDNGVTDGETITPTQNTTFSVTGTDGNGCENTATVTVTVNTLPTVTASATETQLCEGASTVLSGSGALTYAWDNGAVNGQAIVPSASTTYTVVGTDSNGCENSASVSVTVNPLPMVTGNASETEICLGESTVLSGSGALSFAWDNGAENGQAIVPTVSTTYTVIGTDGSGCENSASIDITVNQLPSATITASGPTDLCEGSSVTLSANPIGSYVWNTGSMDAAITVDSEGDFSVTVTDGNGCSNTSEVVQVSVFETIVAEVTASGSLTFCEGQSVTLTAPDGIDHQWSNGATTQSITLDENSIVSVSLTDANGCASASDVLSVTVNPLPDVTITANGATEFCDGESVELVATSGISYTWSTTATTPSIVVSSSAEVSVTVTDVNGCQNTSNMVQVSVSLPQQAFITASASTVCPGESASLTASAGSQFLWDTGADDQSIEITQHGDYSVIVTDADGCQSFASITIDEGAAVVAELVVTGELELCAGETVTLSVSDAGSFDGFLWSNGSTSSSITVSLAADYSVTVNGSAACVPAVQVLGPVTVTVSSVVPQVSQDGNILSVTNGPFISYQWFRNGSPIPGADEATHEATISGNYYVRVTAPGGCVTQSLNAEVTVTVSVTELDRSELSVFPNPSVSGIFQLSETTTGTVFNMIGLMVAEVEKSSMIDLSGSSSGVYFLRTDQGALHRLIR